MRGESWTTEAITARMVELGGDEKVSEYLQLGETLAIRRGLKKKKMGIVESLAYVLLALGIAACTIGVLLYIF